MPIARYIRHPFFHALVMRFDGFFVLFDGFFVVFRAGLFPFVLVFGTLFPALFFLFIAFLGALFLAFFLRLFLLAALLLRTFFSLGCSCSAWFFRAFLFGLFFLGALLFARSFLAAFLLRTRLLAFGPFGFAGFGLGRFSFPAFRNLLDALDGFLCAFRCLARKLGRSFGLLGCFARGFLRPFADGGFRFFLPALRRSAGVGRRRTALVFADPTRPLQAHFQCRPSAASLTSTALLVVCRRRILVFILELFIAHFFFCLCVLKPLLPPLMTGYVQGHAASHQRLSGRRRAASSVIIEVSAVTLC